MINNYTKHLKYLILLVLFLSVTKLMAQEVPAAFINESGNADLPKTLNHIVASASTTSTSVVLTTSAATSITAVSATLGGNITSDGGKNVTWRGVLYSSIDKTPFHSETDVLSAEVGEGSGLFSKTIDGLTPETT